MKLYADSPVRRRRQQAADLALLAFCAGCLWLAGRVNATVSGLADPPRQAGEAAGDLSSSLRSAGEAVSQVPLVPDEVATPFDGGADAADSMAAAAASTGGAIEDVALYLALVVALLPVAFAAASYLPGRVRWVREASASRRLLDSADDLDVFALRALVRQPLHALARVSDDPAGAWRRRDPDVVHRLAVLELREWGLEPGRSHRPRESVVGES